MRCGRVSDERMESHFSRTMPLSSCWRYTTFIHPNGYHTIFRELSPNIYIYVGIDIDDIRYHMYTIYISKKNIRLCSSLCCVV